MRYLVRLVTPPGGVVLDPFAGSGTTVEAAILEGLQCIAIEREAEYLPLIEARIARTKEQTCTTPTPTPTPVTESPGSSSPAETDATKPVSAAPSSGALPSPATANATALAADALALFDLEEPA